MNSYELISRMINIVVYILINNVNRKNEASKMHRRGKIVNKKIYNKNYKKYYKNIS